ncbi:MAG: winged helix-turn-helix domain-containing protein [Sedimenticola sp.]|nr:winged helix-turn-helix domain-containing protein [Sedimenticola sp.]
MNQPKRTSNARPASGAMDYRIADWSVHPDRNELSQGDRAVRLEPKAMEVLNHLASRQGDVVSREELEAAVWTDVVVGYDTLTGAIQKIRKALKDDPRNPRFIETISKKGYRLVAPVIPGDEPPRVTQPPLPGRSNTRTGTPGWSPFQNRRYILLLLLVLAGGLVELALWRGGEDASVSIPGTVSIAVLPFDNLGRNPEQDYFANGITEDLITDLSKVTGLRVVARNSAFAYQGSGESEQQIGEDLQVRFLIRGNVRREDGRLRINVRLLDVKDGSNRWAERYDREISGIFKLQDEITRHIVSALQIELSTDERMKIVRNYATSVQAYDLYLKGLDHFGRRSGEDNALAQYYFQQAINTEPGYARAYSSLALTYSLNSINGWGTSLDRPLVQAESLALKARQLNADLPQVYFVLAVVEMYKRNHAQALRELEKAIELKPSYADAYGMMAWVLHFAGRPGEGMDALNMAIYLNPRVPGVYLMVQGALHYELEQFPTAINSLERAVEKNPGYQLARVFLAASYAAEGQLEDAGWQVSEITASNPQFSLTTVEQGSPIRDPAYMERLLRDLRRAGLSD